MAKKKRILNALGEYLEKRSVNKAEVSRRTGIHQTRMTWLCYEPIHYLRSSELELIAKAINENGYEMHKELFASLQLKEEFSPSENVINNITKELTEKKIISQLGLTAQDIKRISELLPFCQEERVESEIFSHLGLKRKSSRMTASIKACVETGWLKMRQKNTEEGFLSYYIITEQGKKIMESEK